MEQIKDKQITDFKNLSGGLELLVELSEKGDIDPWDVDILDVTEKYLMALDKTPRENLLNAGRAIFYASVLLRMKSEILLNISNETLLASRQTENFFPEDELLLSQEEIILDPSRLESYIVRSSIGKQQRKRKILLTDLITALQQAEEEEERRALRSKLRAERAFTIAAIEDPENFLEIAHEEDIDDIVEKTEAIIQEYLTEDKPITLNFLAERMNNKANPFIALLFLVHAQKIVIEQKEIYGDVYIYKAGTVIEESIEEKKETENAAKPKAKKKKGIIDKIKDKIRGKNKKEPEKKIIEVTSEGDEIIEFNVKGISGEMQDTKPESEVIADGQ